MCVESLTFAESDKKSPVFHRRKSGNIMLDWRTLPQRFIEQLYSSLSDREKNKQKTICNKRHSTIGTPD